MDEFLSTAGMIRRLALLAAINCAVTCAAEPPVQSAEQLQKTELRSLLTRGWQPASNASLLPPLPSPLTADVDLAVPTTNSTADVAIVRPKAKLLGVEEAAQQILRAVDRDSNREADLSELLTKAPVIRSDQRTIKPPAKVVSLPTTLVDQSLELPSVHARKKQLLNSNAQQHGFGLLAIEEIAPPELPNNEPIISNTAIIHANKLQEMSRKMLQDSASALRRGAVFTARKKATSALRSVIAMRDAEVGGNQNMRQLQVAQDAIRESRDFGLGVEVMQSGSLQRLVDIHDTETLKDTPLAEVSPLHATESYLACAKEHFVSACGSALEASYALTLLGKIEKKSNEETNPHALAIALTYQRAAVEIDPSNAYAFYEMGKTLLSQGLVQQAQDALLRSVELSPNRGSYQKLLQAARKLGDIDTVRRCNLALTNQSLPTELPVVQLNIMDFAATYRPGPNPVEHSAVPSRNAATRVSQPTKSVDASKSTSKMARLRNWFSIGSK